MVFGTSGSTLRLSRWNTAASLAVALFVLAAAPPEKSHGMAVPAGLQAAIIKKVLSYDTTLPQGSQAALRIVIVRDGVAEADLEALLGSFAANHVETRVVAASALAANLPGAMAVYTSNPRVARDVAQAAEAAHVLSFTGMSSLVDEGLISVGLDEADGRPKIVVNMMRLQKEGHALAAGLLALARVVR